MEVPVEDIVAKLCEFLREQVLAEGVEVSGDTVLADIGVDSFSLMEILLFLERAYGLVFPLEVLTPENIQTVHTLADCYRGMLAEQGA
jgi:acyl carrier protein